MSTELIELKKMLESLVDDVYKALEKVSAMVETEEWERAELEGDAQREANVRLN